MIVMVVILLVMMVLRTSSGNLLLLFLGCWYCDCCRIGLLAGSLYKNFELASIRRGLVLSKLIASKSP